MAVPDFSLLHDFCHGLLVEGASVGLVSRRATPEKRGGLDTLFRFFNRCLKRPRTQV